MGKVGPLLVFGLALTVGGAYWALWDASREYLEDFVISDAYYELMYWGFRVIPAVLMIVGIMCLIAAGVAARGSKEVVEY